jgi:dTDP-4-amino-4,6-dideoxygalactose transaminase
LYDSILNWNKLVKPHVNQQVETNYAYYPIFLESEGKLFEVRTALEANGFVPRRYFYPSLSSLKFVIDESNCPISDDYAPRALALPLYYDLAHEDVRKIANIVNSCL